MNGATPEVVASVNDLDYRGLVLLASTDWVVRSHIVAAHGIERLEELKGKRIGVSGLMHNIICRARVGRPDGMGPSE